MSEGQQQVIELPLSNQYCRNWSVIDALREIIANAVDSGSRVDVRWEDGPSGGVAIVTNSNGVLVRSNLVLGGTTKVDDEDTIGTFGEGLKIGAMVLLREGKSTFVRSGNLQMEFFQGYSDALECSITKVGVKEIPFRAGTEVRIYGVDEETLCETKGLFLQLGDADPLYFNDEGSVYETPLHETGTLHLQGVQVYDGRGDHGPLLFTWNLKGLEINRDRSLIDFWAVRMHMGYLLNECDNYDTIHAFLKVWMVSPDEVYKYDWVEVHIDLNLNDEVKDTWKRAAEEVVGSQDITCVDTGLGSNPEFGAHNYKCVDLHGKAEEFLKKMGWKTDLDVLMDGASNEFILADGLTDEEQRLLSNAKKMAEMAVGVDDDDYTLKVFERTVRESQLDVNDILDLLIRGKSMTNTLGELERDSNTVYIRRSILDERLYWKLVEVIAHELVHKASMAGDCSRRFENHIFKVVINLMKMGGLKGTYY